MPDVDISSVDTVALEAPLDEPFGYAQEWVDTRSALLVRIEADDGTVGWGECWGPIAGSRETIDDLLAPILVGEDPLDIERLHDRLYDVSRAAYQSIVPLPAISGLDIALWDLRGKLLDESVSRLLGGRRRDALPAYGTGHYFKPVEDLDEQYTAIVAEAEGNADALGAIKLKIGLSLLGHGHEADIELVRRVRDAVGPDVDVMVDANYAYDRPTAAAVGHELATLDVRWFEEPVAPENYAGYSALQRELDIPVAGGECQTPAEFAHLLSEGALDVAQPDLCNVGGLTAARRIAERARADGTALVPHVWGTPIAIAAALHLLAVLPRERPLEFDRSDNPLRESLAPIPFAPDADGRVAVPEGPGLGIDLDADAIERYRVDGGQA
ncbi:mandelate racemase/muconate lactonizing enzyme family protein [Halarchaeum salinum]|uniref:D-galactarolactone cycloisomerase n=1 Tax=Halarchaeum salinum TaxID=489912 RepID=A0AAV3SB85_9EURY